MEIIISNKKNMGIDTQGGKEHNEKYSNFERLLSEDSKKIFTELIEIFKKSGLNINKDIDVVAMIGRWQKDKKSFNNFKSMNPSIKEGLDDLIEELEENNIYLDVYYYVAKNSQMVDEIHSTTDRHGMGDY